MAYRAKRIMRRSSLYPSTKFNSAGGPSKVGFIDSTTQSSSSRKRQSLASSLSDYNDSIGYLSKTNHDNRIFEFSI